MVIAINPTIEPTSVHPMPANAPRLIVAPISATAHSITGFAAKAMPVAHVCGAGRIVRHSAPRMIATTKASSHTRPSSACCTHSTPKAARAIAPTSVRPGSR
jgi:hypothetical protein